jgi:hypothetical protein
MNCLNIGARTIEREGWKTLDANPDYRPDFLAKLPPLPHAVKTVAWDAIHWIHGIGSLYPWEAEPLLLELRDVLAPDGCLTLEQPDFSKAIQRVDWVYGDPAFKDPLHMVRWGYTPESLASLLRRAGFRHVDVLPAVYHNPARDFRIDAYK